MMMFWAAIVAPALATPDTVPRSPVSSDASIVKLPAGTDSNSNDPSTLVATIATRRLPPANDEPSSR